MMVNSPLQLWSIWSEGYACTGERGTARKHATVRASTFEEACRRFFKDDPLFNADRMTYWGCRLFSDEKEARRSFA